MHGQLQQLLNPETSTPCLQHLSLRNVSWEGKLEIPAQVVSFAYYPTIYTTWRLSLEKTECLWQISTFCIYSQTHQTQFVNTLQNVKSLQRIILNDMDCRYVCSESCFFFTFCLLINKN